MGEFFQIAFNHTCADCTRPKRFHEDLLKEGAILARSAYLVADVDNPGTVLVSTSII